MKKVLWMQKLGLRPILFLLMKSLFFDTSVHYDEKGLSAVGKRLLILLKKFKSCKNFHSFTFKGDKKKPDGSSIFYEIYRDMEKCMGKFNRAFIPGESEAFKKMLAAYLLNWDSSPFHFISGIKNDILGLKDAEHVVYISDFPVDVVIEKFYDPAGFKIKRIRSLTKYLLYIAKPFALFLMIFLHQVLSRKIRTNIRNIRPSVWVEYEGKRNMLSFWRRFIKSDKFDLVYYIDRDDTDISSPTLDKCAEEGFKWIDGKKMNLARFDFNDIRQILAALLSYNIKEPLWLHFFKFYAVIRYRAYHSIFSRFKVKAYVQHHDTAWWPQAQVTALEAAGGIMIGFHWSNIHISQPFMLTPEHVYFVWGKDMYEFMQRKGHTCRYILPCGLWISSDEAEKEEVKFYDKVNFIIAILDSSVSELIYHTPATLSEFYLNLLNLIERNASWGGIIKSKLWQLDNLSFLPMGDMIISKMNKLKRLGRLVYLNPTYSSLSASTCADLTATYGLHTAGIIAGVCGCPSVMWDVAGWLEYPLYRDKEQRFLYNSLQNLEEAIIGFNKGDRKIGDISKWRQKVDYFNDKKAPERVASFIDDYMNEVISNDDANRSLETAARKYIDKNSVKEDFFKIENFWQDQ